MKKEIGKLTFFAVIVLVLVTIGWAFLYFSETPENRGLNEEAIFRAAEKKAKAHGVDIRTLPKWGELYYKYHPEEKPPMGGASSEVPPTTVIPGQAAPSASEQQDGMPPAPPGGMVPPASPGGMSPP
ncbi:MAG TPA: hypothetical protein VNJ09_08930 [Chthonomonadales bacterium]|nr:hypothetical protein [Chthonomonadales bacterium]